MVCSLPCEPARAATFDPAPGTFDGPQRVRISSATPGAVVRYTTDGSTPTAKSPVYKGPIEVEKTTTIKTIAQVPGLPASAVAAGAFAIAPPPVAEPAQPSQPEPQVRVTPQRLEIGEKVQFETGKAAIVAGTTAILDDVAETMKQHPEVEHVVVEGHTDAQGSEAYNEKLSQGRADAVRGYLVGKGVEPERLEAKGYGSSRPVADNDTAEGRETNRRVDFVVVSPPSEETAPTGTGSGDRSP
jgi:outer membrane protein OmpA-like peptidoglycan-associated protein